MSIFYDKNSIRCPNCESMGDTGLYTHVSSAKIVNGNDNYEAGWEGRGDLTVIRFYCEAGHTWELCIGFHKGNSYLFKRIIIS